jgi:hypothetical protein
MPVEIRDFGRDHWSLFGYIETVCVDHEGVPELWRLRCNAQTHPALVGAHTGGRFYPTRTRTQEIPGHDDWDCADDLEAAGLILVGGTGINPIFRMTDLGLRLAGELRFHKARGGTFSTFVPTEPIP